MNSPTDSQNPALIRLSFSAGMALGLILALIFAWRWTNAGAGTRIQVLGSGKYASVLITHEQRRILIASGSNGSGFSNAISTALPAIGNEIDVLLIDPRSSADVVDRARSLDAKRVIVLPDADHAETLHRSFVIDLSGGVTLSVRVESDNTWTAELATSAGVVAITPGESTSPAPIWISLDGAFGGLSSNRHVRIGPATNGLARTPTVATVRAGSVLPIQVDDSAFRIPRSYFGTSNSGERAHHLARLDRKLLLEFGPHRHPELFVAHHVKSGEGHGLGDADRVLIAHL